MPYVLVVVLVLVVFGVCVARGAGDAKSAAPAEQSAPAKRGAASKSDLEKRLADLARKPVPRDLKMGWNPLFSLCIYRAGYCNAFRSIKQCTCRAG